MSGVFESGCCGAEFRNDRVTVAGLLTLSVPLVFLSAPLLALLCFWPAEGPWGRPKRILRVLLRSNLDLVRQAALAPKLRCACAGTLYAVSPRVSGFVYKHFNLASFSGFYAGLLAAAWLAAEAVRR